MKLGRKPVRQAAIATELRHRIIRGQWVEGQQIPPRAELARQFGAPPLTVRRAIARLINDGFLQSRPRRGMFVCDHLPHQHRYALVMPHDPADTTTLWSRLFTALINEAPAVARPLHKTIIPFYGLDEGPRAADYARLAQWCADDSVAGMIFASHPYKLMGTPILEKKGIPRVAWMSEQVFPNVPAVWSGRGFLAKAFAWLAGRGRRRVAVLMQPAAFSSEDVFAEAARHGLEIRPHRLLLLYHVVLEAAGDYAHLLMNAREEERPDALLIADDNYIESALSGLRAAGVQLGREVDVLAQCNFPWAGALPPQVKKLGYSAHEVLQTCLDLLERQRRGDPVPALTTIEARFEGEQQLRTGHDRATEPVAVKGADK